MRAGQMGGAGLGWAGGREGKGNKEMRSHQYPGMEKAGCNGQVAAPVSKGGQPEGQDCGHKGGQTIVGCASVKGIH